FADDIVFFVDDNVNQLRDSLRQGWGVTLASVEAVSSLKINLSKVYNIRGMVDDFKYLESELNRVNITKTIRKFSIDRNLRPTGPEFHPGGIPKLLKHGDEGDEEYGEGSVSLTAANFEGFTHQYPILVVNFYAPWCYWSNRMICSPKLCCCYCWQARYFRRLNWVWQSSSLNWHSFLVVLDVAGQVGLSLQQGKEKEDDVDVASREVLINGWTQWRKIINGMNFGDRKDGSKESSQGRWLWFQKKDAGGLDMSMFRRLGGRMVVNSKVLLGEDLGHILYW
ncbi:disulfide isomerase-like 5-4, partial [Thalictrum thalictroides]